MDRVFGKWECHFCGVPPPVSRDSDVCQHARKAPARVPVPVPVVQALDVLRTQDTGLQASCQDMASADDGRRVRQRGSAIKPIPFPDLSKLGGDGGGQAQAAPTTKPAPSPPPPSPAPPAPAPLPSPPQVLWAPPALVQPQSPAPQVRRSMTFHSRSCSVSRETTRSSGSQTRSRACANGGSGERNPQAASFRIRHDFCACFALFPIAESSRGWWAVV